MTSTIPKIQRPACPDATVKSLQIEYCDPFKARPNKRPTTTPPKMARPPVRETGNVWSDRVVGQSRRASLDDGEQSHGVKPTADRKSRARRRRAPRVAPAFFGTPQPVPAGFPRT